MDKQVKIKSKPAGGGKPADMPASTDTKPVKQVKFKVDEEADNLKPFGPKKKPRQRLTGILKQLRNQMEFYFSDSNLSKDRFMKQHIQKDPEGYVPLTTILSFNKVQELTKQACYEDPKNLLTLAVKDSKMLKLSEDGTKLHRATPVKYLTEEEVDERTIYVDQLPPNVNHEWLKGQFSQCGNVTYVSLPRFKTTNRYKGFAFVEFETTEQAAKALENINLKKSNTVNLEQDMEKLLYLKECTNLIYWKERAKKEGIGPEKVDEAMKESMEEVTQEAAGAPKKSKKKKKKKKKKKGSTAAGGEAKSEVEAGTQPTKTDAHQGGTGEGDKTQPTELAAPKPKKKKRKKRKLSGSQPEQGAGDDAEIEAKVPRLQQQSPVYWTMPSPDIRNMFERPRTEVMVDPRQVPDEAGAAAGGPSPGYCFVGTDPASYHHVLNDEPAPSFRPVVARPGESPLQPQPQASPLWTVDQPAPLEPWMVSPERSSSYHMPVLKSAKKAASSTATRAELAPPSPSGFLEPESVADNAGSSQVREERKQKQEDSSDANPETFPVPGAKKRSKKRKKNKASDSDSEGPEKKKARESDSEGKKSKEESDSEESDRHKKHCDSEGKTTKESDPEGSKKKKKSESDQDSKDDSSKKKQQRNRDSGEGVKEDSAAESGSALHKEAKKRKRKRGRSLDSREAKKQKKMEVEEVLEKSVEEKPEDGDKDGKKRRKRKKVLKTYWKLRVFSKKEWLRLKQLYLSLQKRVMQKLKTMLHDRSRQGNGKTRTQDKNGAKDDAGAGKDNNGAGQDNIGAQGHNHGKDSTAAENTNSQKKKHDTPVFVPNVILKIESDVGMCYEVLKADIPPVINVSYVDVKAGLGTGYIRCADHRSAQKLLELGLAGCTLSMVQGEAEKVYWDKLMSDRDARLSKTSRQKRRGKNKLLQRAQNPFEEGTGPRAKYHKFNDDDDFNMELIKDVKKTPKDVDGDDGELKKFEENFSMYDSPMYNNLD